MRTQSRDGYVRVTVEITAQAKTDLVNLASELSDPMGEAVSVAGLIRTAVKDLLHRHGASAAERTPLTHTVTASAAPLTHTATAPAPVSNQPAAAAAPAPVSNQPAADAAPVPGSRPRGGMLAGLVTSTGKELAPAQSETAPAPAPAPPGSGMMARLTEQSKVSGVAMCVGDGSSCYYGALPGGRRCARCAKKVGQLPA